MTGQPDFRELVGDEGTPEELAQLRRAHEWLLAAGPPPELSPRLAEAPQSIGRTTWLPRRRRSAAFVLAAGVAAAAFSVGFLVSNRGSNEFPSRGTPIAMHALASGSTARASILIGERDAVGNWPLLMRVSGLQPLPKNVWYELYLTRNGKPAAYCGGFSVSSSGRATVRYTVPYQLKDYNGWIITPSNTKGRQDVVLTT
jgi:hypothetical protein